MPSTHRSEKHACMVGLALHHLAKVVYQTELLAKTFEFSGQAPKISGRVDGDTNGCTVRNNQGKGSQLP